jgi:3-oxoacyl-[acyl-carrier protein] reductase
VTTPLHALVLGGSGHLGAALVPLLRTLGLDVDFTFLKSEGRARALEAATGARAHSVDLRQPAAIQDLFARLDEAGRPPDVLIHAASVVRSVMLHEQTVADFDEASAVGPRSAFVAIQALAARKRRAEVVLVGAMDGVAPVPAPAPFGASQAALLGLCRGLCRELGTQDIRINMIILSVLDGGISSDLSQTLRDAFTKFSALGRIGTASEAARAIAWLATENTYMTGATVSVSGGL